MSQRFLDDASFLRECHDFVTRKHVVPLWIFALIFASCTSFILIIDAAFPGLPYIAIGASISLFFILFIANVYLDSRYKELINAVEFQNALFAGAARIATEFCLIAMHDGKIVYIDPEYDQRIFRFRNNKMRNINTLLDAGEVNDEAK